VEDFARRTGLTCRIWVLPGDSTLGRECATAVFRILQESLTNVARYARATAIDVRFVEDPADATLTIADNGCGITAAQIANPRSIGLLGMRERAQAFGGTVEITGVPGAGTTVRVRIPIEGKDPSGLP
jgi:signal transduction histidine kinase